MARSIRYIRTGIQGRVRENFNWPGVITSSKTVVNVTAGEVKPGTTNGPNSVGPGQDFYYHLGDAVVWVTNISPHKNDFTGDPGGVEYFLHALTDSPVDVGITITVEDNLPEEIQGYRI